MPFSKYIRILQETGEAVDVLRGRTDRTCTIKSGRTSCCTCSRYCRFRYCTTSAVIVILAIELAFLLFFISLLALFPLLVCLLLTLQLFLMTATLFLLTITLLFLTFLLASVFFSAFSIFSLFFFFSFISLISFAALIVIVCQWGEPAFLITRIAHSLLHILLCVVSALFAASLYSYQPTLRAGGVLSAPLCAMPSMPSIWILS